MMKWKMKNEKENDVSALSSFVIGSSYGVWSREKINPNEGLYLLNSVWNAKRIGSAPGETSNFCEPS